MKMKTNLLKASIVLGVGILIYAFLTMVCSQVTNELEGLTNNYAIQVAQQNQKIKKLEAHIFKNIKILELKTSSSHNILDNKIEAIDTAINSKSKRWGNIKKVRAAVQATYGKMKITTLNRYSAAVVDASNEYDVPVPLILAVTRQESAFQPHVVSHAGAQGLMQLMPYTAKLVSKQAKLPYSKSRLTSDPEYNINLGSHYIAGLILEYDGAYPFAIAAYNAGPKRVRYWKKINKNPQKKQINYVDWIELIKFKETRNYVQRVLENYNVYRYILEKKPVKMKNFFIDRPLF